MGHNLHFTAVRRMEQLFCFCLKESLSRCESRYSRTRQSKYEEKLVSENAEPLGKKDMEQATRQRERSYTGETRTGIQRESASNTEVSGSCSLLKLHCIDFKNHNYSVGPRNAILEFSNYQVERSLILFLVTQDTVPRPAILASLRNLLDILDLRSHPLIHWESMF